MEKAIYSKDGKRVINLKPRETFKTENVQFEWDTETPSASTGSGGGTKKKKKKKRSVQGGQQQVIIDNIALDEQSIVYGVMEAKRRADRMRVGADRGGVVPGVSGGPRNFGGSGNNGSAVDERARIKQFWLSLGEEQRRSLVKVEKEAVLSKMKQQQRNTCNCAVCGRKRVAIEQELESLYSAYFHELESLSDAQEMPILPLPSLSFFKNDDGLRREHDTTADGTDGVAEVTAATRQLSLAQNPALVSVGKVAETEEEGDTEEDEIGEHVYGAGGASRASNGNASTVAAASAASTSAPPTAPVPPVPVPGSLLTVADDLLTNDGKKFIEMMEQLADKRAARGEESADEEYDDDEQYEDYEDDDEYDEYDEYDDNDDDYEDYDDHEGGNLSDAQRMEEGRRMFQIFAARMFEQRVLHAYRESQAAKRQAELLKELEEEEQRELERKKRDDERRERKKEKKRALKAIKDEEKRRVEQERAEQQRIEAEAAEKIRLEEEAKRLEREKEKEARKAANEARQKARLAEQERLAREKEEQRMARIREKEAKIKRDKEAEEARKEAEVARIREERIREEMEKEAEARAAEAKAEEERIKEEQAKAAEEERVREEERLREKMREELRLKEELKLREEAEQARVQAIAEAEARAAEVRAAEARAAEARAESRNTPSPGPGGINNASNAKSLLNALLRPAQPGQAVSDHGMSSTYSPSPVHGHIGAVGGVGAVGGGHTPSSGTPLSASPLPSNHNNHMGHGLSPRVSTPPMIPISPPTAPVLPATQPTTRFDPWNSSYSGIMGQPLSQPFSSPARSIWGSVGEVPGHVIRQAALDAYEELHKSGKVDPSGFANSRALQSCAQKYAQGQSFGVSELFKACESCFDICGSLMKPRGGL